jgi:hypothetical protein
MQVKEMTDEDLLSDMMDWFRIGRNKGGLEGDERKHFKNLCNEIGRRGLLDPSKLYIDKS